MWTELIFCVSAILALVCATASLISRKTSRAVLFFAAAMLATSGALLAVREEFLGAILLFIGIGGIGIALLALSRAAAPGEEMRFGRAQGVLLSAIILALGIPMALAFHGVGHLPRSPGVRGAADTIGAQRIAESLLGNFLLPFEAISVLLVAAIVAVVLASRRGLE